MPEQKLTKEELDAGRRSSAAVKSAQFMITNIKTDSTTVLHAAHHLYIETQLEHNRFWQRLFDNYPELSRTAEAIIHWHTGMLSWKEKESSS